MIFSHARDHLASGYNWPWNYLVLLVPSPMCVFHTIVSSRKQLLKCQNWPSQSLFKNQKQQWNSFLPILKKKIEFSVIFWRFFYTHKKIISSDFLAKNYQNCNPRIFGDFLAQKIQNVALNLPQFICTKNGTLYKIPSMFLIFCPSN